MVVLFLCTVFSCEDTIVGFPPSENNYVGKMVTVSSLCHFVANSRVIETSAGYAVVDVSRRAS